MVWVDRRCERQLLAGGVHLAGRANCIASDHELHLGLTDASCGKRGDSLRSHVPGGARELARRRQQRCPDERGRLNIALRSQRRPPAPERSDFGQLCHRAGRTISLRG